MKKIWYLVVLLTTGSMLYAQNLKVIDALERKPIERAMVRPSTDDFVPDYTDDRGIVSLSGLRGKSEIIISALGYETVSYSYEDIKTMGFEVALEPSRLALDQVVVAANRWSQSSRELPFHIRGLKTRDVLLQAPQTSADLLGGSGEVFIQKSQQGGGSPMIRGFATNRLLIAIDGVRMNNAIFRSGNLQQVISLDPLAVERTEIYFGPGSVIYGSDAIGGVMSFSTLRPELTNTEGTEFKGNLYSRFSSANQELSQHLDLNIGGQKWAWRGSFSYSNYGDLRMGSQGSDELLRTFSVVRQDSNDVVLSNSNPELQVNTGFEQFHTLQKLRFRPSTYWDFEYSLLYSSTSNYDRYDRLIRTRDGQPRSAEWYYGPQSWMMNKFQVDYRKSSLLSDGITLRLAYQNFEESRHDRDFGDPNLRSREEQVDAFSLNLDLKKRLSAYHKLFYGIEFLQNDVRSVGSSLNLNSQEITAVASRYPNSSWASYAAYLNHEWEISTELTSQIGVRYNQFVINSDFRPNLEFYPLPFEEANINQGNLTGSMGFVYRPSESWKWRLNFGTAFRAPNVDDIGKVFDSGNEVVVIPNPDLRAEYAYNGEAGFATLIRKELKLDFSAYYTLLDNALVRRNFSLNGADSLIYDGELSQIQAIQNAAEARVYGLQLGLIWDLNEKWSWRNQFNWQRGQEEDNDGLVGPSRHAAPWFGISRLRYQNENLQLELNSQVSGQVAAEDLNFEEQNKEHLYLRDANGELYSPAWYSLNFKASYQAWDAWLFTAGIENITDQRYRPYSSGLVAPGRNFVMAVRFSF